MTTTTIQKWGNSHAVRLPKTILEALLLHENDRVEILSESDTIIIRKTTRRRRANKSLEERFKNYKASMKSYDCTEYDWGEPVGNEVWE